MTKAHLRENKGDHVKDHCRPEKLWRGVLVPGEASHFRDYAVVLTVKFTMQFCNIP